MSEHEGAPIDTAALRAAFVQAQAPVVVISKPLAIALLDEIDRLSRREHCWAADAAWRANWMTGAVGLLGEILDTLEDQIIESGNMAAVEALLHDEYEDGDDE